MFCPLDLKPCQLQFLVLSPVPVCLLPARATMLGMQILNVGAHIVYTAACKPSCLCNGNSLSAASAVPAIFAQCCLGFILLWIVTPTSFSLSDASNVRPLMVYSYLGLALPTCITLHFFSLKAIPHFFAHSCILCHCIIICCGFVALGTIEILC